jgi:hypothetical protein
MNAETMRARADAHDQADKLGLLDAVRVLAKSGSNHQGAQWIKDWELFERDARGDAVKLPSKPLEGYRFFYGERQSDSNEPYGEVLKLHYSVDRPVHEQGHPRPNAMDSVTHTELLYKHTDRDGGATVCFRSGPWVEKVLTEAKRVGALPKVQAEPVTSEHFEPFND